MDAFETDVRPLLAQARVEMGLHPDPLQAYLQENYAKKVAEERGLALVGGSAIQ